MFLILILLNNFHCSKCDHKAYNKAEFKILFIYNYLLSRRWMLLVMCCENPLSSCCISPTRRDTGAISQTQLMDLLKENVKAWLLKWNSLGQVWVTSKHFIWRRLPRAKKPELHSSLLAAQSHHGLQKGEVIPVPRRMAPQELYLQQGLTGRTLHAPCIQLWSPLFHVDLNVTRTADLGIK